MWERPYQRKRILHFLYILYTNLHIQDITVQRKLILSKSLLNHLVGLDIVAAFERRCRPWTSRQLKANIYNSNIFLRARPDLCYPYNTLS